MLTLASHPDEADADWEGRVLRDGRLIEKRVIRSPGKGTDLSVDLSA